MKAWKRVLCLVLTLTLLCVALTVTVLATETEIAASGDCGAEDSDITSAAVEDGVQVLGNCLCAINANVLMSLI